MQMPFHSHVESNEQTELTGKIETDSEIESRLAALGAGLRGGETKQKGKRTHGHGHSVVIAGGRGE